MIPANTPTFYDTMFNFTQTTPFEERFAIANWTSAGTVLQPTHMLWDWKRDMNDTIYKYMYPQTFQPGGNNDPFQLMMQWAMGDGQMNPVKQMMQMMGLGANTGFGGGGAPMPAAGNFSANDPSTMAPPGAETGESGSESGEDSFMKMIGGIFSAIESF